jgi:hypothetical protein
MKKESFFFFQVGNIRSMTPNAVKHGPFLDFTVSKSEICHLISCLLLSSLQLLS